MFALQLLQLLARACRLQNLIRMLRVSIASDGSVIRVKRHVVILPGLWRNQPFVAHHPFLLYHRSYARGNLSGIKFILTPLIASRSIFQLDNIMANGGKQDVIDMAKLIQACAARERWDQSLATSVAEP